jgi:HPr kinase/phosphorylase
MPSTEPSIPVVPTVPVTIQELLDPGNGLELHLLGGEAGVSNGITVPRIQKPGLALTGWPEQLHDGRVLVLGGTEIAYLQGIAAAAVDQGIATVLSSKPACIVICRGLAAPPPLLAACDGGRVPLLVSHLTTSDFIAAVTGWLGERLAPRSQIHGVLLDVLGIGILVLGKSGIGKSETALDLVVRGHRLVADDVVQLWQKGPSVFGHGSGMISHHVEIRGLGIINIKDLFGIAAVRETKKIELVAELVEWDENEEYDRLGIDDQTLSILGIRVPKICLPVRPGRNIATIIEVAARNQLLKAQGHHSARELQVKLGRALVEARLAAEAEAAE